MTEHPFPYRVLSDLPGRGRDGAQRFAKRDVDVTEQSAVDAGLGHHLAAAGVRALLRVQQRQRFAVAQQLYVAEVGDVIGAAGFFHALEAERSEEHTSELQSLMRSSYAVFCLTKKNEKHY